ncbi:MAG TPA: PorV/PorQ family protein [Bacteroidetes bacterium]|nr:PorV/PorQ family protein [Bacteroidota bacterium]
MRNRILSALLLFLCWATFAQAQSVRKYSNEFLKIGVGARASAMGNAMVGIVSDATAGYWNPGGLSLAQAVPELALMHSEYFAGIAKYDYVGFTMPIGGRRRFGASIIRLGVDDIPNTLNLVDPNGNIDFDAVETFSVADLAVLLSLAQRVDVMGGLDVGANFKVVNRAVGKFANAWGFGLDLGARWNNGPLNLGLMLRDVTSTFNAWTFNTETFEQAFVETGNVIPENSIEITLPSVTLGGGYTILRDRPVEILVALDNDIHFDGKRNVIANLGGISIDPHMGLEVGYKKVAYLRGGFKNLQQIKNAKGKEVYAVFPTVGAGFFLKNFTVDYALSNVGNFSQTLYSHIFSLKYTFNSLK